MWLDSLVENMIKDAVEHGEFDNLSCAGRPLDLSDYFGVPERFRLQYSILKNAGFVPEEVQLLKDAESLRAASKTCVDPAEKTRLTKLLHETRLRFDLLMERYKRR